MTWLPNWPTSRKSYEKKSECWREEHATTAHQISLCCRRDQRKSQETRTLELRDINAKLSDKLRDLKEEQSTLLNELEDAKQDKNTVHARLVSIMQGMKG